MSGSKTVSTLNGKVTPGSSYSTYKKWVSVKGKDIVKCSDGDQVIFFNNIGKYISKSYRVSSEKYTRPDIITATLHLSLGKENLQAKEEFKLTNSKNLTNQQKDMLVWKEIEAR